MIIPRKNKAKKVRLVYLPIVLQLLILYHNNIHMKVNLPWMANLPSQPNDLP